MKKAIVTGATGFIGSHICKKLLKDGYVVYGIGRNDKKLSELDKMVNLHPIKLDFVNYDKMPQIIKERGFDFFIHTALYGVNGVDKRDYDIQLMNTKLSCDSVKLARELNCRRFILVGSVDEFESCFAPDDPFIEPSNARVYGLAKFAAENIGKTIALDLGMEYVSALLSLTYGEGNKTNILPNAMIRNTESGKAMDLISGDTYFDIIYIDDAVSGILSVAEKGKNMESYFVGHESLNTFKEIVLDIYTALDSNIRLNFGTYPDAKSVVRFDRINRSKIRRDTGFECRADVKNSILKTREWILKMPEEE